MNIKGLLNPRRWFRRAPKEIEYVPLKTEQPSSSLLERIRFFEQQMRHSPNPYHRLAAGRFGRDPRMALRGVPSDDRLSVSPESFGAGIDLRSREFIASLTDDKADRGAVVMGGLPPRSTPRPPSSVAVEAALDKMIDHDTPGTRVDYLLALLDEGQRACAWRGGDISTAWLFDNLIRVALDVREAIRASGCADFDLRLDNPADPT